MHLTYRKAISPNSVVMLFFIACISSCATIAPAPQAMTAPEQTMAQHTDADLQQGAQQQTAIASAEAEMLRGAEQPYQARQDAQPQVKTGAERRQKKSRPRKAAKRLARLSALGSVAAIVGLTEVGLTGSPKESDDKTGQIPPSTTAPVPGQDEAVAYAAEADAAMATAAPSEPAALVKEGSAVYYVPKQMTELQTNTVTLWIDADTTLEQLVSDFAAALNLDAAKVSAHTLTTAKDPAVAGTDRSGEITRTRLLVTDIMHAELSAGPEFTITPQGKIKQSLSNTGRAKWPWQVTPNLAADSAELRINIWIDPTGTGTLTESYSNVIRVYPKPQSWVDKLYQVLTEINAWLALLGIGGVGVILQLVYRRVNKNPQQADG